MLHVGKILLFVLMIVSSSCIREKTTGADLKVGDVIPDFQISMNDGTIVTGSQLKKGISVIVFFTTACPDCRNTLPEVQKIYDEYLAKGVSFALISRAETSGTILPYWKAEGFTMPFSPQEDRRIYELFASSRVPRVYICKDGIINTIFTDLLESPTYDDIKHVLEGI